MWSCLIFISAGFRTQSVAEGRWSHLSFMKEVDVCVDGRFLMEEKDNRLRWKGSRNQRVIDVKATFAAEKEGNDVILHCEEF